jgi:hypothetical protein
MSSRQPGRFFSIHEAARLLGLDYLEKLFGDEHGDAKLTDLLQRARPAAAVTRFGQQKQKNGVGKQAASCVSG